MFPERIPDATLLAECSRLAYRRPGEGFSRFWRRLELELADREVMLVSVIDKGDAQAFIGYYHDCRITCYRGTDSVQDSVTNLFARRSKDPVISGAKVHNQFGLDASVVSMTAERETDYFDGRQDFITGHSRGGAAALIHATRLNQKRASTSTRLLPAICVTHEMPRAGNRKFAEAARGLTPHVRWQRAGDIVPLVPLPPLYWHDRPSKFFDHQGVIRPGARFLTSFYEWARAIASHAGMPGIASIALHSMNDLAGMIKREERAFGENLIPHLLA